MPSPALFIQRPASKTAGAIVLAVVLAGCAQQQPAGYYDVPHDTTTSDAQKQAQGRDGARAPSQIQLGFGGEQAARQAEAQEQEAADTANAIKVRQLAEAKTFLGTLPCLTGPAGCSPTRVTLTLAPAGQWRSRTALLDQPGSTNNIVQQGCWSIIGTQPLRILLQLKNEASKANLTFVNDNVLRVNMIDGIQPALDYHLTRQADIDPIDELKPQEALRCGG